MTPEARAEAFADQLLLRWGVIFRDLLARETLAPPWRDLLPILRRKEAQGEIRGGRFVSGFSGEQFARPEARIQAHVDAIVEVLLLSEVEEMSYQEIAETLSIPMGTVMSRLSRARKALGEQLRSQVQGR